ncbi:hypothetical protein VK792_15805 [Mesobacterium sp. TK19101]|uniref:Endonuclease n=1 Tax=Mesobacterium hydrothermale TaxID=3111907 RepID=A0ABU6HJX7_9RHOB|nr:hypothetical protein [Mesobacterium sp. TK19101]MEC3862757.1 hypothetical protein [Mesobacterium sp. TK19101]
MRRVDRTSIDPPKVLTDPGQAGPEELIKARAYRADPATKDKSFGFKVYKHAEVKAALDRLFHGKCAYCESFYSAQAPVDVEHFRPKGAVEGASDHPGYWWLGMVWENLLPSCIDCNRRRRQVTPDPNASLTRLFEAAKDTYNTGKKDVFPVAGTRAKGETDALELERAYLLDPCRDDPGAHLDYYIDPENLLGLILPRAQPGGVAALPALGDAGQIADAASQSGVSARGAVSIQVYGLNRLGLVQERTRVLRHLEFLRHLIHDIDAIAGELDSHPDPKVKEAAKSLRGLVDRIIAEIRDLAAPEAPYSALVRAWTKRFVTELKAEV